MNEALKTALNEARALAEAARTAAEAGNPEAARRLLAELDALREECERRGIPVHLGRRLQHLERAPDTVTARFDDGPTP